MIQDSLFDTGEIQRSAILSECGKYRYSLARIWDVNKPLAGWVLLNPSTADATEDDPTIRRCIAFAKSWGCGGLHVVNLFAWRATDPAALRIAPHPVGEKNDTYILAAALSCSPLVAAWGTNGSYLSRDMAVRRLLQAASIPLVCLGLTMMGDPRHPLYLRSDAALTPFPSGRATEVSEEL